MQIVSRCMAFIIFFLLVSKAWALPVTFGEYQARFDNGSIGTLTLQSDGHASIRICQEDESDCWFNNVDWIPSEDALILKIYEEGGKESGDFEALAVKAISSNQVDFDGTVFSLVSDNDTKNQQQSTKQINGSIGIWNSNAVYINRGVTSYTFTIDVFGFDETLSHLTIATNYGTIKVDQEFDGSSATRHGSSFLEMQDEPDGSIKIIQATAQVGGKLVDVSSNISAIEFIPLKIIVGN